MIYTDGIHLVADSLEELHMFAKKIGIGKNRYHGFKKGHPHYDLLSIKEAFVVGYAGAIPVSSRTLVLLTKAMMKELTRNPQPITPQP